MPLLDIEIVLPPDENAPQGIAAAIAEAAAAVFQSSPGTTWVRLHELSSGRYSENGGGPGPGIQPVFVQVLHASIPPQTELEQEASALATAVARICNRPVEHVHIVYEPGAAGRVAFGGKLFRGKGPVGA